ncbi:MAG TPA: AMP-binding protein, partial [Myxococcaceae bacterium]|nr:AMP-binding protein [Myxococcaceae bacterium]
MDLPRTVLQALHDQASRLGDRPALWAMHRRTWLPTSWRDHAKRVRQFALGLLGLSIAPGEPVAIMAFNGEAWIAAHLGAMATGAIPFGIYVSSTPARVEELLAHSRARAIVVEDARLARMVQGLRERLPKLEHIIVLDPSEGLPEGTHAFGDLVTRGAATREQLYWERVHALEPDGVATLVYQGREGAPRAVMLSHRNLLWTAAKLSASYQLNEERLFSYLPLTHIAELLMSVVGPLLMPSAQVYLSTGAAMLEQELEEAQPTIFFAPPRVWERFV